MKIDPSHLEILAAVVDRGGVTEAAAHLGKSQPSLSRTLAQLERRIGEALFQRGHRPLRPTELGSMLAAQGRRIAEAGAAAGASLTQYRAGRAGVVRVGGTPFFMDGVVSSIIAGFQQQNPDVRIDQQYAYAPELQDMLRNGSIDLAICPVRQGAKAEGLTQVQLLPGRNVIACRRDHPLLRKRAPALTDIGDYSWIAPPQGSPLYNDLKSVLTRIGLPDFKVAFSGGSLGSVLNMIAASDSLTVLPYSVVFALRRNFAIEALNIQLDHPERHLSTLSRADGQPTPAARRFEKHIVAAFAAMQHAIVHAEKKAIWRG